MSVAVEQLHFPYHAFHACFAAYTSQPHLRCRSSVFSCRDCGYFLTWLYVAEIVRSFDDSAPSSLFHFRVRCGAVGRREERRNGAMDKIK